MSPIIGATWSAYDANVFHIFQEPELLSFAYQWHGEKKVHVKARCDYKDKTDKSLAMDLWALFDEADILVGHNIVRFDIKKANERFIANGLKDPSFYRTVDTLKVYKKYFASPKNGLDYICQKHNIGGKVPHQGADLWLKCMEGSKKDWKLMKKYNKQDVAINMELYEFLLPWITNHPNMNDFTDEEVCPNCGSTERWIHGYRSKNGTVYRRLQCKCCHAHYKQSVSKKGQHGRITGK